MSLFKRFSCFCLLLLTFGCKDITHVQTGYVGDRDECRGSSESNVGVYSQPDSYPMNDKDRNVALLQLFCECMKGKDWKVAGCPKAPPPPQVAQGPGQQPTVVVVQSPASQPGVVAEAAEPAPAPAAGTGRKRRKAVCNPPNTCPAPTEYYNSGSSNQTPIQSDQQLNGILQRQ